MKAKKYTVQEIQEKLNLALSPDKPMLQQLEQLGVKELIEELSIYQQELEYQNDELRKSQVSLEKSQRYAEDLFEMAPVAYVVLDDDFRMKRFNELFIASFARSAVEIAKNTDFRRLISPNDQDDFHRFLKQEGEGPQKNGITLHVGGRYFHLRAQYSLVEEMPEWRVSLTDVHNEQLILAALAQSERRFRNLVRLAPGIIVTMKEHSHTLTFVSDYISGFLGLDPVDMVGTQLKDWVYADDQSIVADFITALVQMEVGANPIRCELRMPNSLGVGCWTTLIAQKLWDVDSNKHYYLCIAHPIDELKLQQIALEEQNQRLQHFSHIVSHNLSSYVANVHSLVDLMGDEAMSTKEKGELYPVLKQATNNLQEAINHLNEMLKIQRNGHLGKVKLFLKAELDKVLSALKNEVEKAGLQVSVKVDEWMTVCFHPAYLQSILLNMCSNALRYKRLGKDAKLRISARYLGNQTIGMVFEDNGLGMDLKTMGHKLFGMFQTFHDHPESKGLGLFMVKNQLSAMGGSIHVESKVGEGTKFELRIPGCLKLEQSMVD